MGTSLRSGLDRNHFLCSMVICAAAQVRPSPAINQAYGLGYLKLDPLRVRALAIEVFPQVPIS